jgi:hypothetical protein
MLWSRGRSLDTALVVSNHGAHHASEPTAAAARVSLRDGGGYTRGGEGDFEYQGHQELHLVLYIRNWSSGVVLGGLPQCHPNLGLLLPQWSACNTPCSKQACMERLTCNPPYGY